MKHLKDITADALVNSLCDGVYACDLERRVTFWSAAATRITGWHAADVVGRQCFDNVLCHVDKDGHQLCDSDYCPLHRAMITGEPSQDSLLVYAQGAQGQRIPMEVTVAPVHNASGEVIGGLETFRDATSVVGDLERAKAIQQMAMKQEVPEHGPLAFNAYYVSRDIVGGDYYAIKQLGEGLYGVMLADVAGHGVAAALYTMHLSTVWNRYHPLLANPVAYTEKANEEAAAIMKANMTFATAICGLIDLNEQVFRFTSAGGPAVVLMHPDGECRSLQRAGFPLGLMAAPDYGECAVEVRSGDRLLLFTDGATEIQSASGDMLGADGLIGLLRRRGYPQVPADWGVLHEDILKYSNRIRLDDDMTIIEVGFEQGDAT